MTRSLTTLAAAALLLAFASTATAQSRAYKVLATNKTSTMQKELQEAGQLGYRFMAVMGGETVGGQQVVVLVGKTDGDQNTYDYRLLATRKTSTMQEELQESGDAGFQAVGQTVFQSLFGGLETVAIVEKSSGEAAKRWEYKLIATNRTSTLDKELRDAASDGFEAVDLAVGKTSFGGNEVVVITRRAK